MHGKTTRLHEDQQTGVVATAVSRQSPNAYKGTGNYIEQQLTRETHSSNLKTRTETSSKFQVKHL